MTAATASPVATTPTTGPTFFSTLASEWVKLRSVRATYIEVVLTVGLALAMTALISLAIGSTFEDLSAEDQATFDPVFTSFFGSAFGAIVMVVLGVTFVSSEYTSGMIRQTLTTTPRRLRVLGAKALIVAGVTLVLGTVTAFGSFWIGQAVLGSYEGVPTASLEGDALRSVVAASLTAPLFPIIGACLGAILRSTASAITTVMSILFLPAFLGGLLPDVIQRNVMRYLPGNASDQLLITTEDTDSVLYLDIGPAIALVVLWLVAFYAVACISMTRRDV
jgi:ABC-type transport system involved in multi-copper enzyme maturation permease subunit